MRTRSSKGSLSALGAALVALLALGALFGSASASAATQHWYGSAGGVKLAEGTPTEVVGEGTSSTVIEFSEAAGGLTIECNSMSAAGAIENPSGGADGTLGSVSMTLAECAVSKPAACVVPATIEMNQLKGTATEYNGSPAIKYEPASGSILTTLSITGSSCSLKGTRNITGSFIAEYLGSGGDYRVTKLSSAGLNWLGQAVTMNSTHELSKAGSAVALATDTPTKGKHWYLGGAPAEGPDTKLAEGSSVSYSSLTGSVTYTVSATVGGVKNTIQCSGPGNWAGGSVENPTGGGAGTAYGSMVFAGCIVSQPANCVVELGGAGSKSLSGLATEAGGVPAVSFSPAEGSTIATFTIGGAKCPAALKGAKSLTGGLTGVPDSSGTYAFSGAGLKYAGQTATLSGQATLQTTSTSERLLLAP